MTPYDVVESAADAAGQASVGWERSGGTMGAGRSVAARVVIQQTLEVGGGTSGDKAET